MNAILYCLGDCVIEGTIEARFTINRKTYTFDDNTKQLIKSG